MMDITKIGTFGISFSKGLDSTWFNLWRKEDGYSMDLYQDVETEGEDDDDDENEDGPISTIKKVPLELGESILRQIYEDGHLEEWKLRYLPEDEGPVTELNWTIDVDDTNDQDVLLVSGNWKFPPNGWMDEILKAVRTGEPDFGKCFKDLA